MLALSRLKVERKNLSKEKEVKIKDLKPGMDNINLKVRVLEAYKPKIIQTKKGSRIISEAIVGDETGRTKMTLWGKKAGTIEEGEALEIRNAFVTAFRGQAQLNVGKQGEIVKINNEDVISKEEVPEVTPKAEGYRKPYSSGYRRKGPFKGKRGGR